MLSAMATLLLAAQGADAFARAATQQQDRQQKPAACPREHEAPGLKQQQEEPPRAAQGLPPQAPAPAIAEPPVPPRAPRLEQDKVWPAPKPLPAARKSAPAQRRAPRSNAPEARPADGGAALDTRDATVCTPGPTGSSTDAPPRRADTPGRECPSPWSKRVRALALAFRVVPGGQLWGAAVGARTTGTVGGGPSPGRRAGTAGQE